MTPYPKYKPSGIEWIGDIPEHWEVKRLKRLAKILNGRDHKEVWDENGMYPVIGTGGIFGWATDYLHSGPSVILGRKGTIDKPQFITTPFWSVDTAYFTDIFPDINPKYFYYLCTTINFEEYKYGSAVPSMTQETLNQIQFSITKDLDEQTAIADYLDAKTAAIDELIAAKQKLIELYEEEKTALINHAVTKGLNSNAPMKDSGIEWLGEIPAHWEVKKLSWCFNTIGSGTTPQAGNEDYYFNGEHNWLLTGDLTDGEIHLTSKKVTHLALDKHTSLKKYPVNSIVIAMYGATIAKLGILKIETTVNQACCVLGDPNNIDYLFAFYTLLAARKEIINMSYGGGQPNISQELLRSFRIQVPPTINEQQSIVTYIETESKKIDTQITNTTQLIELLTEYRTALISEVVTGKIKIV